MYFEKVYNRVLMGRKEKKEISHAIMLWLLVFVILSILVIMLSILTIGLLATVIIKAHIDNLILVWKYLFLSNSGVVAARGSNL